jgi:hypothetical protein
VQETYLAFKPRDAAEAQLAALAVAAAQAAADGYTRAAKPGVGNETAARNRSGALASARVYFQIFRFFKSREKAEASAANPPPHRAGAPAREPKPQPDDTPIPSLPQFQPRDRHGNPIPLHRWQDMTRNQKLATYGDPYDTGAWATATAEEEAMIAAQKALDESGAADPPAPVAGADNVADQGTTEGTSDQASTRTTPPIPLNETRSHLAPS